MAIKPKEKCPGCNRVMAIVAKGLCSKCYNTLYPAAERRKYRTRVAVAKERDSGFPRKEMIPMWVTSDGKEWGMEIDALRHQLDLERNK